MIGLRVVNWKDSAESEAGAIERIKRRASVPDICGPEIIAAPARGPMRVMDSQSTQWGENGEVTRVSHGYQGRKLAKVCDVFDMMQARAKRELFTPAQIEIGRRFAGLVERHAKGAIKCSSFEANVGGSGGGDFMDTFVSEGREIDQMRHAARWDHTGQEVIAIKVVSRGKARLIMSGDLVERVCLGQRSMSQVLRDYAMSNSGRNIERTTQALSDALDRMNSIKVKKVSPHCFTDRVA